MQRAVVAIGVKKTGQLPELQAAVDSATRFATWARTLQKIPVSRVKLLTDAKGPVSRDRIFEAVEKFTQLGFLEQLIVYFSGHGINSGLFEQWLLSRAPDDPGAAVSVKGSEFGARFCGIGHVVFISDACRTAADSIQAQRVTGGEIFPNVKPTGPERPVDQFYATLVGHPAFEVKTIQESTARYRAAYSTVLMEALRGEVSALIEPSAGVGLIRPRPLKRHLSTAVPRLFSTLNLPGGESSQPDARIESDQDAWIAQVPLTAPPSPAADSGPTPRSRGLGAPERAGGGGESGGEVLPPVAVERPAAAAPSLESEAAIAFREALHPAAPVPRTRAVRGPGGDRASTPSSGLYEALISGGQAFFGPDHFETQCGIKVRGTRIGDAFSRPSTVSVGSQNDVVRVDLASGREGANVLVQLTDGSVVLVPAFRDCITGLSFDGEGDLQDVWCEPSANTSRFDIYARSMGEIRRLRAVIAASTALGVFRIDGEEEAAALLERLQRAGAVDPALAVYAAYALHDRRMRSRIVDMQRHLDADLRVRIFDVAMLAFSMNREPTREEPTAIYPCVPMLTQGWTLLSPLGITLPGGLGALRGDLRPALWTHFTAAAADRLHHVLSQGELE